MGLTLLVLAAGQGTRFGGLKQMEPVGPHGETMLDYAVFDAQRAGFMRVVFVVGSAFSALFEARIAARYAGKMEVACVCQYLEDVPAGHAVPPGRTRPWGTLHAVWAARAVIDRPFVVVNADDFYGREAYQRIADFFAEPAGVATGPLRCCMVAYGLGRTLSGGGGVNRGICMVEDGLLRGVVEHTGIVRQGDSWCSGIGPDGLPVLLRKDAVASMNIWGFTPEILVPMGDYFGRFLDLQAGSTGAECYLPDLVNHMVRADTARCRVLPNSGAWFGITYAQDKPRCVAALHALTGIGEYPVSLMEPPLSE